MSSKASRIAATVEQKRCSSCLNSSKTPKTLRLSPKSAQLCLARPSFLLTRSNYHPILPCCGQQSRLFTKSAPTLDRFCSALPSKAFFSSKSLQQPPNSAQLCLARPSFLLDRSNSRPIVLSSARQRHLFLNTAPTLGQFCSAQPSKAFFSSEPS